MVMGYQPQELSAGLCRSGRTDQVSWPDLAITPRTWLVRVTVLDRLFRIILLVLTGRLVTVDLVSVSTCWTG